MIYKITDNQLEDLQHHKDIFEDIKDEKEWGYVLFQWSTNWGTFAGNNKKILSYQKSD